MINNDIINILGNILGPFVAGFAIWLIGQKGTERKMKSDSIRDLMTLRGDYSSANFSRALNKISITFHNDLDVKKEIRSLWEAINNPSSNEEYVNRKIVGLIYNLCKSNGFKGMTEYDIDQAFPESKQTGPIGLDSNPANPPRSKKKK